MWLSLNICFWYFCRLTFKSQMVWLLSRPPGKLTMGLKYQTAQVFTHKTCQMKLPGEVLAQQTDWLIQWKFSWPRVRCFLRIFEKLAWLNISPSAVWIQLPASAKGETEMRFKLQLNPLKSSTLGKLCRQIDVILKTRIPANKISLNYPCITRPYTKSRLH